MEKASGVVQSLGQRQATSGGTYVLLRLEGQEGGFFDWDGKLDEAGVDVGDEVAIFHSTGEYPRILRVERPTGTPGEPESGIADEASVVRNDREIQIARMCALKAAARLLQESGLPYEQRVEEATKLAESLENWVLR